MQIARDGPTALRLALQNPPDLILLDIMMPGMDGYEVYRRLKANPRASDILVIFVTGMDETADSRSAGNDADGCQLVLDQVVCQARSRAAA